MFFFKPLVAVTVCTLAKKYTFLLPVSCYLATVSSGGGNRAVNNKCKQCRFQNIKSALQMFYEDLEDTYNVFW